MATRSKPNRREQILAEAAALFTQKGYQATGMRELADQVGIEPASIYSHFGSKEQLLWELANQCAQDFHSAAEQARKQEANPLNRLRSLIHGHVNVTIRNINSAVVFDTEWQHLGPTKRGEYARMRDEYERVFRDTITEGIAKGVFRKVDEKFAALTILSALNFTYKWYRPSGTMTPEQIGQRLADTLIFGLNAQPTA